MEPVAGLKHLAQSLLFGGLQLGQGASGPLRCSCPKFDLFSFWEKQVSLFQVLNLIFFPIKIDPLILKIELGESL